VSDQISTDHLLTRLAADAQEREPAAEKTSSRLKSRIYSALIRKQQESGPLQTVSDTKGSGSPLCYFEDLVQIVPVGERAEQFNCCSVCHARVLGERVEPAPIWWPHCPYVRFQNR
jgi:hypothetical protein